jgi:hypothetical protein
MAEAAKDRRAATGPEGGAAAAVPDVEAGGGSHAAGVCPVAWCPICMTVTAVQPLRPDVIEHLLKAGTELLLAFRGVIDARAEEMDPSAPAGPTHLEKIDIG